MGRVPVLSPLSALSALSLNRLSPRLDGSPRLYVVAYEFQPLDGFERAVRLNHRHEHLTEPFVLIRTIRHCKTADIENPGLLNGSNQILASWVRSCLLECCP